MPVDHYMLGKLFHNGPQNGSRRQDMWLEFMDERKWREAQENISLNREMDMVWEKCTSRIYAYVPREQITNSSLGRA